MKKLTAIEWLWEMQLKPLSEWPENIYEQAKEMEKQQIAHSWAASLWSKEIDQTFEEYFKETYKTDKHETTNPHSNTNFI